MKKLTVTGWYIHNDDWHDIVLEAKYDTLEQAQEAAEIHYKRPWIPKMYSMSISDGIDIWKWKPGREWQKQGSVAA